MSSNSDMPLFHALRKYADSKFLPFHMPGHMGGSIFPPEFAKSLIDIDFTELPGLDNLYNPCGIIEQAQKQAAKVFGADSTFFLVNGSTAGIHAMIAGTLKSGDKLLVPRNCHRSVAAAMALCDIQPIYIKNDYSREHALLLPISEEQVVQAFKCNPDASGILLVNPDYYGICGQLTEIGKITRKLGKLLLVDEAHGAHFPFHEKLPISAAYAQADAWVQSAHKTLPSLTQTGFLHIKGNRVNPDRVLKMLSFFQTSSPSYILMASLDWSRFFMEVNGNKRLGELIDTIQKITASLKARWGVKTIADYSLTENISAIDPTKLCLDVSSRFTSGYEALEKLREQRIEPEMADFHRLVFICTIAHDSRSLKLLYEKLNLILKISDLNNRLPEFPDMYNTLPIQIMSPRQAFNSIMENIPLQNSEGRVCGNAIGAYPPGTPRFCPGEMIDAEGIEELTTIKSFGGNLFGLSGDGLVSVVK